MAYSRATSSGVLAVSAGAEIIGSAARTSGINQGVLWGLTITPAAAACTLSIYDNAAGDNSGLLLERISGVANGASIVIDYACGTAFVNGLSYVLSGTGAVAVVRFELGG